MLNSIQTHFLWHILWNIPSSLIFLAIIMFHSMIRTLICLLYQIYEDFTFRNSSFRWFYQTRTRSLYLHSWIHILFGNTFLSSFITKSFPYSNNLSNYVHFIKCNYLIWMNLIFVMYSIYALWLFIIHYFNSLPWTKTKKRNKAFSPFL